jgi:Arm DNA-binding domain
MRTKLTPSFVQKARAESGAERALYWDEDMPGFGLLVTASGHRSFVVQYRFRGRSRRMTIDGVLGLAAGRKRARALLGEVARDRDPLQERRNAASLAEDTFKTIAEAISPATAKSFARSVLAAPRSSASFIPGSGRSRSAPSAAATSCAYSTASRTRAAPSWPTARSPTSARS